MGPLLTPKQVATILNCKTSSIYAWAKEGKIPAYKLNGILRFDSKEMEEWVKQHRLGSTKQKDLAEKILKSTGIVDVNGVIDNAIASVKRTNYNTPQRGNQTSQAQKQKGGCGGTV